MLRPDERHLLLDALRPPEGTTVDVAVGTTYTLDLLALLLTPLGFAMFEAERLADADVVSIDEMAVLEAVRRYADITTVFCHRGAIALPTKYRLDTVFTEDMVQQVRPLADGRAFHPKVWVLRFNGESGRQHRVVVLSRNLTLDRSWDTILVLDEAVVDQGQAGAERVATGSQLGRDVSRWLTDLGRLPGASLTADRAEQPNDLAGSIASVRFVPPEPFTDLAFHSLGVSEPDSASSNDPGLWPFLDEADQLAVVSPFLGATALSRLSNSVAGNRSVLISRPDAMAVMSPDILSGFTELRALAPEARDPDEIEDESNASGSVTGPSVGSGLHAKVFIQDCGPLSSVFVGSANATGAAFGGNVEALVQLDGPADEVGVDALMEGRPGAAALGDLTVPWQGDEEQPDPDDQAADELSRLLEQVTAREYRINAEAVDDEQQSFQIQLSWEPLELPEVRVRTWLISRRSDIATDLVLDTGAAQLGTASFQGLTPFLALELRRQPSAAGRGPVAASNRGLTVVRVVRCETTGFPQDRAARSLAELLSDPARVLRYLMLLLADGDPIVSGVVAPRAQEPSSRGGSATFFGPSGFPLFEMLVRALDENPAVLDRIHRVVADLTESGADDRLPEGWHQIWEPIWVARQELISTAQGRATE